MTLRRLPCSPAAPPLEDDNLLAEILLRLPPLPSSLPRASAVSRRWRSLASDPRFSRRFRAHHRRNPPLLGCFFNDFRNILFQPALEFPNRIPPCRFPFPIDHVVPLGCRHGLMLMFHPKRNQLLVWEPFTGDQYRLDIPPGSGNTFSAAVLRAAGDVRYFQVVLVGTNNMHQAFASVYSSKTGLWGNLTTATLLPGDSSEGTWVAQDMPAVMVGDSLYWLLVGHSFGGILEFDLGRRSPCMIPLPADKTVADGEFRDTLLLAELRDTLLIRAEGGCLGHLTVYGFNLVLWKRKKDSDGVASWVLGRTIALDKLLPIDSDDKKIPVILGFAEDNNVVLVWTSIGVFTVQLESLQFKKIFESKEWCYGYFPFEGVYTADKGIDGLHDGAELLQNT